MRACEGIKIVEVSAGLSVAALCGQLFAGLGASVEVFDGGPASLDASDAYLRTLLEQGKQVASGADDLEQAIGAADLVIVDRSIASLPEALQNPSVFEQRWPDKVLCTTSLCGAGNARSHWTGNELIAEAVSGLMTCNGYPERPAVASGLPYTLHTSALFAFGAVLVALRERDASGKGQSIDLSVVDCVTSILGNFLPSYFLSGKTPARIGNRHTIAAPWNLYPARDGAVVICTGTGGAGWWAKVMSVIGRPELTESPRYATEADRVRNVEEVDEIVSAWTSEHSMKEIVDQMSARAIPAGEIGTIEMVLEDPHYRELREMVLADPATGRPGIGNPLKVGAWPQTGAKANGAAAPHRPAALATQDRPLAGLRVVEFASRTSVPLAGRLMKDFGADVVKIEPVKGDALRGAGQQKGGASYLFHINNAGKRSVMIDPTDPRGRDTILQLIGEADVFVENLAPGSVEKMGLGPAAAAAVNPRLVYCSVSGFGERSAHGGKRALDTVVQAASGLMHMTGYPDHKAVKLGISAVDLTTAAAAMAAILAGLRERDRTGAGTRIDLAMADVGVWMTQAAWPQLLCQNAHPTRLGNRSATASPHDVFDAADGKSVAIAVVDDRQWRALVALIGDPCLEDARFATAAGRLGDRDAVHTAVTAWVRRQSAEVVAESCQAAGVPAGVMRDLADLVADPVTTARGMVVEVETPGAGRLRLLGNPAKLSRTPPIIAGAAPALGADTAQVLREWLAMEPQHIAALAADQVILTPAAAELAGI